MNATQLLSEAISNLFVQVSNSGRITLRDRHYLMMALLEETTSDEEKQAIDRLLYGVRLGRIQIIEE